jgi:hypothetical protein
VNGQFHDPAVLLSGKSPWYPLDRRPGGPQNQSERDGEEEKNHIIAFAGNRTLAIQPIA